MIEVKLLNRSLHRWMRWSQDLPYRIVDLTYVFNIKKSISMFYVDIGWWINHTVKWNLILTADMYISILVCKMLNSNEKDRYVWNKSVKLSQIPLSMFLCTVTVAFLSFYFSYRDFMLRYIQLFDIFPSHKENFFLFRQPSR